MKLIARITNSNTAKNQLQGSGSEVSAAPGAEVINVHVHASAYRCKYLILLEKIFSNKIKLHKA